MDEKVISKINYLRENQIQSKLGRKPIIFIDQDDVLAKHNEKVVKEMNRIHGTHFTMADITEWDLISILGEECKDIMFRPEFFETLEPMEYAIENLRVLNESNLFDIYIASAAHPSACHFKYKWFKENMPFLEKKQLIFISHKFLLNGDLLFDDAPHNITAFRSGEVVIFDKPYNRHLVNFDRVKDWNEFTEYLVNKFYE